MDMPVDDHVESSAGTLPSTGKLLTTYTPELTSIAELITQ